jgi:O-antigen/teichoic acid export membrane protein
VRVAHPWLGETFPLGRDRAHWRELFGASGWVYLFSVGNLIFSATDSLLINKGFGPEAVTPYQLNYRIVELIIQVIGSAAVIGMSKINLWIHSPEPENKERARAAVERLLTFQSSIATFGAMAYLAIDSMLIGTIFGHWRVVSLPLQWAFALNLAVTMCGDAGIQVAGIATRTGVRTAGAAIGITALLNLGLSYAAMKMGSIEGIAYATVIAQTLLSWFLGWHVCRVLKLSCSRWFLRSWLLPAVFVSATAWAQWRIGPGTWTGAAILFSIVCVLGIIHALLAGVNREFLRKELSVLRSLLPN